MTQAQIQTKSQELEKWAPQLTPLPPRLTQTGIISGHRDRPKEPEDEACKSLEKGDARIIWAIKLVDHEKIITNRSGDMLLGGHFSPEHLPICQRTFDQVLKLALMQPLTAAYMAYVTRKLGVAKPTEQTNDHPNNDRPGPGWL